MTTPRAARTVGRSPCRPDGHDKVTGSALFVDDLQVENCWHGATVRCPHPRARVLSIDSSAARADPEVRVVTAADLPGPNMLRVIADDWPILADEIAEHADEAVALVTAPTRARALAAAAAVRVEYEPLPAILDLDDALAEPRELAAVDVARGDVEAALAAAPIVVEGSYSTGLQEHIYIEPQGVIATPLADGRIDIVGSIQCPYYVHGSLSHVFGPGKLRVRQAVTGGGFGGKEEFPDLIAAHAALLALASGHPVKIIYDRSEDIRATTKRHPSRVSLRAGVSADGKLLALDADVLFDGGAYVTLSPVVLSRGVLHAGGPYAVPDVRIRGRVLATNTVPGGAFRGFGAPQTQFAMERLMDAVARATGLDPFEVRARNAYRPGDLTPTGQVLDESTSAVECLETAAERSDFRRRWAENERERAATHAAGRAAPGLGLALFWHGTGFTGNGERQMRSPVHLALLPGGTLEVRVSSTDFGQGTSIVLAQIVADAADVPLDAVRVAMPDTDLVPDSGPTVASRTVMVVGSTLHRAGLTLARKLAAHAEQRLGLPAQSTRLRDGALIDAEGKSLQTLEELSAAYLAEHGELLVEERYDSPPESSFDETTYQGDAYCTYGFGCDVVSVDVDPDTFAVTMREATLVADVGRTIHPVLCRGQVEGGSLQALAHGTLEDMVHENGRVKQDRLATYIIPTTLDTPAMDCVLLEHPSPADALGAKGVGELPADGGAPSVVAAIENATGIVSSAIPATPERLLADLLAGNIVGTTPAVDTALTDLAARAEAVPGGAANDVGEAAAGGADLAQAASAGAERPSADATEAPKREPITVAFDVNGRAVELRLDPMTRLLDALREDLALTGTKEGCGEGECGSCTVLLDGEPVCSCLVPVAQVAGRTVLSVEGLAPDGELDPVQRAMVDEGGVQCGACTPGILVSGRALLNRDGAPDREVVREALSGNLCRCTGYEAILRAFAKVADDADSGAAGRHASSATDASGDSTLGAEADG